MRGNAAGVDQSVPPTRASYQECPVAAVPFVNNNLQRYRTLAIAPHEMGSQGAVGVGRVSHGDAVPSSAASVTQVVAIGGQLYGSD
jgi:hypothetical protein